MLQPAELPLHGDAAAVEAAELVRVPLDARVEAGRDHESNFVAPLLDKLRARGVEPRGAALDKGYDSNRVHAECAERDVLPVIPIKGERASQIVMPIIEGVDNHSDGYGVR